jgi:hypothetical protein
MARIRLELPAISMNSAGVGLEGYESVRNLRAN